LVLETDRLLLRPYEKDDYESYLAMVAHPEPNVRWRQTMSAEDAWHRLVRYVGHWTLFGYGNFAVLDRLSGAYLGETGFWDARRGMGDGYDDYDETGWSIVSQWHGRGIAFEAADAAHRWYSDAVGQRRTVCMTDPANVPSIRLARKLGYRPFRDGAYKGNAVTMFERVP
jgi:RimJ/RimL family protein N-acetyltransferase